MIALILLISEISGLYKEHRQELFTSTQWAVNQGVQSGLTLSSLKTQWFNLKIRLFDRRWREIRKRIKPGQLVLDGGCGMGEWVQFLKLNGIEGIGLDYAAEMIRSLKQTYPETEWVQGELQHLPIPDNHVDGVISWGVIEHDENGPQEALKEFHRVCKVGGSIFVTVPFNTPHARRSSMSQFGDTQNNEHFFQYYMTETELGNFVKEAGFEVEWVGASSRHYALVFPRLYYAAVKRGVVVNSLVQLLVMPIIAFLPSSLSMVMAIGRKTHE